MKLDKDQKEDFYDYWGRCPMVNEKGQFCTVDIVHKLGGGKYEIVAHSYDIDKRDGRDVGAIVPPIHVQKYICNNLEAFDPIFFEPGYYQITDTICAYLSKKTERNMVKGVHHSNHEFLNVNKVNEKTDIPQLRKLDFDTKWLFRIWKNRLPRFFEDGETINDAFQRKSLQYGAQSNPSYALSRNVALISSTFDIPLVFYKMIPVGYTLQNKIYIDSKKDISKETIMEETGLPVEIYEG